MHPRLLAIAVAASILVAIPAPGIAHSQLKKGPYECYFYQSHTYANKILKIEDGGKYTWMDDDGTDKKHGTYTRDGQKLRFTSGYLHKQNYRGKHDSYTNSFGHTHLIYLYKNAWSFDNVVYDCNNN